MANVFPLVAFIVTLDDAVLKSDPLYEMGAAIFIFKTSVAQVLYITCDKI